MEEITPTPQEKEVEGQREEENKDEYLECELQLSPTRVHKVLTNEIELTKDSSLANLRAECSSLAVSGLHKDPQSQQEDGVVECQKFGE